MLFINMIQTQVEEPNKKGLAEMRGLLLYLSLKMSRDSIISVPPTCLTVCARAPYLRFSNKCQLSIQALLHSFHQNITTAQLFYYRQ